ncbi:MAG: polysaccharide biosynthesis C-terminal domain-containing protein [Clostridia bacterium]|nr:polysaccharide biosynthesis C-terminal domain-containing protein [Clostridia bacterium]
MIDKKYKRLLSNTAILGLGTFGSKILVFLLMPLYTSCLTKAEYSTADIISQSANLLMPILSLGIVDAVFRFTLDKTIDRRQVLTTGFAVILAGAAVMLALFPALNAIDYFEGYMWLIILYTVMACLHSLFAQYIRAQGMTAFFALQGIIATAVTILLNLLFLLVFDWAVLGYVLSVVIADAVVSLIIFLRSKLWREIRFFHWNGKLARDMLKFSIPMIPTTIFWWITNVSDRYMVKGMLGDDVNGLYAAAFKIPTMLILLSGIFIEAWQFSAVTERDGESKKAHEHFFGQVFDSFQGMLFISAAGLIAFSKIFSLLLFSDEFYPAWQYMPLLIFATVYSSLVTFMGSVYLVDKKSIQSFITAMIGALVNIVFNLLLIPTVLGANGAALATFLSYFVVFIIRAVNTRRYLRFDLHIPKLTVNTLVIAAQTVFMVLELPGWIVVQAAGIAVIFAINAGPILRGCMKLLRRG